MRALLMLVAVAGCGRIGFGVAALDDALSGDADGDDGPSDDGPMSCAGSYLLCDTFEQGLDTTKWGTEPNVTLDTTFGHRGTSSVHVHTPAFGANQDSYITLAELATLASGVTPFWVRAWFYLSALPAANNGMELVSAQRPGAGGNYIFVFPERTTIYTQFGNANDEVLMTVPVATWFCFVFKVHRSTVTTGELQATSDVLPMLLLPNVRTDGEQPMTVLTLGMGFAAPNVPTPQPALDLWIDDVIVDDAPISCAQ